MKHQSDRPRRRRRCDPGARTNHALRSSARAPRPDNTAASLQTAAGVLAAVVGATGHPDSGVVEPDGMDFRDVLAAARSDLGDMAGVHGEWTPLRDHDALLAEDIANDDPWQFSNILIPRGHFSGLAVNPGGVLVSSGEIGERCRRLGQLPYRRLHKHRTRAIDRPFASSENARMVSAPTDNRLIHFKICRGLNQCFQLFANVPGESWRKT